MFFQPRLHDKISDKRIVVDAAALTVHGVDETDVICGELKQIASEKGAQDLSILCTDIYISIGMDPIVLQKIREHGGSYEPNKEGYAIELGKETYIWAESEAAAVYAAATLRQMKDFDELCECFVYDFPRSSYRGYRVYVPGRAYIDDFKRTIDMLAYYKYNTIIIQVGGAMEYKRHPEINSTWEEYCAYLTEFPYRTKYHRNKWNYPTCGTHPDAGDGSYLTQEEMKDIVDYCKQRRLEVVPEVPSYNHCDYLVMAHPEIRELGRAHGCADGYCPSNPASYALLFDVIDEILQVFEPSYVHIAHDEVCQINKCEKCRERDAGELFLEDVTKIHDYLAAKNVKTMMWADCMCHPMQNGVEVPGRGSGFCKPGDWDYVPATNGCTGKLPKDILMIDWLYSGIYCNTEDIIRSHGYEMVYGNTTWPATNWVERTGRLGILGGIVSNWGSNEIYYARKNQNFSGLTRMAYVFWSENYEENDPQIPFAIYAECHRYFEKYFSPAKEHTIRITHTTDLDMAYGFYHSAKKMELRELLLGNYIVMYEDGTTAQLPVIYGDTISNQTPSRELLSEICCCAEILQGDKIYYTYSYPNPHPEKNILSIGFLKQMPKEFKVSIKTICF